MPNRVAYCVLILLLTGCAASLPKSPLARGTAYGTEIFAQGQSGTPPCSTCHQVVDGKVGFSVGPNLAGIAERAGTRIEGLTAEEYLRLSILEPERYLVSGYRDIMYPDYSAHLTEQNIQDLIAYLFTL